MSQPDRYVGVDFAPPHSPGRLRRPLVTLLVALLALGVVTVAVTQLLLR
jgi:hypothetical protein